MEKVQLELNYALMLEMMKAKGFSNPTIAALLSEGNLDLLESIGEGIPSWKTLVNYYYSNRGVVHQAISEGYEIPALTKEALKSLLSIKFEMHEGEGFVDASDGLDKMYITGDDLEELRKVISSVWTVVLLEENPDEDTFVIKLKLSHEPVLNF